MTSNLSKKQMNFSVNFNFCPKFLISEVFRIHGKKKDYEKVQEISEDFLDMWEWSLMPSSIDFGNYSVFKQEGGDLIKVTYNPQK